MKTIVETMENFVDDLCEKIDNLTAHSFTAKEQSAFLKKQKLDLSADAAILILDFAENYQYVIQDEVQSYHWSKEYCSLHPVSIYLRDSEGKLICDSLCVISDDLKHDTVFVKEVMQIAVQYCKMYPKHLKL